MTSLEVSNKKKTGSCRDVLSNLIFSITDDWLSHTLQFEHSAVAVLARDASTKQDDWYDVYDPRNPLNKRKRGDKGGGGGGGNSSRSHRN